ncbi:hypothetical protein FRB90_003139, partial [Tulasnella sp. 427]
HNGIDKPARGIQATTASANVTIGPPSANADTDSTAPLMSIGDGPKLIWVKRSPRSAVVAVLEVENRPSINNATTRLASKAVSTVAGFSTREKFASFLLSSEPASNSAFALDVSNSAPTYVFLVPVSSTSAAAVPNYRSIGVVLHVPVPDKASMFDYCMTYGPDSPSPPPVTSQGCTDQITAYQLRVLQLGEPFLRCIPRPLNHLLLLLASSSI